MYLFLNMFQALAYKTCLLTGDGGADGTLLYPNYPNLLGDRFEYIGTINNQR